jgi:hypothetical protein
LKILLGFSFPSCKVHAVGFRGREFSTTLLHPWVQTPEHPFALPTLKPTRGNKYQFTNRGKVTIADSSSIMLQNPSHERKALAEFTSVNP